MAPNKHKASQRHQRRKASKDSCSSWLKMKGHEEFDKWRADNLTQQITYDEWKSSNHVDGLSLFFAAAAIFDESDTSDDDKDGRADVQPRPRASRTHSVREPKKKVTMNDRGLAPTASSATPSTPAISDDASPSGKRKRKTKKVFLSEEVIASDGETAAEHDQLVGAVENTTPTVPTIAVNGKRKSSGRKPKKKVLSEEIISLEDELDDPMDIDEAMAAPIVSPLPVRSAPKAKTKTKPKAPVPTPEPPRKTHILKLSTRRAPKKIDSIDEADQAVPVKTPIAISPVDATAQARIDTGIIAQNGSITHLGESEEASAAVSPNPTDLSASATRRGLRTRRPAQQRPYYHDAQLFDDVETATSNAEDHSTVSPESRSRRTSAISFVGKPYDAEILAHLDAESLAILQDSGGDDDDDASQRRPKTFKGKGRAWKKEESDEDEEFIVAQKKAAKAARAKAKAQQAASTPVPGPKKRGRPRKNFPVGDAASGSPSVSTTTSPSRALKDAATAAKKPRKVARKSALSAEIIQDSESDGLHGDDDGDGDGQVNGDANASLTTLSISNDPVTSTPGPDSAGRPHESEQESDQGPKLSLVLNLGERHPDADANANIITEPEPEPEPAQRSTTTSPLESPMPMPMPIETSFSPEGIPGVLEPSYTPKGIPERPQLLSPDDDPVADVDIDADMDADAKADTTHTLDNTTSAAPSTPIVTNTSTQPE